MTEGRSIRVVSTSVADTNKYMAFIAGDQPLIRIETGVPGNDSILVIKESFGNAFVPFLCNNYKTVYVVDPRYVKEMDLPQFLADNGVREVLFMNYLFVPSNSAYMSGLEKIIG